MKTSNNAAGQPKRTLLTGFDSFDSVAQNYTPKYLDAYLYCHSIDEEHLSKGFLPRCPLLEQIYKDTTVSDIFFPPNFPKPIQSKSHSEYKLAAIGQLISYLNWWVQEKVDPERPVFWFYAYSYVPCERRVALVNHILNDLITEFNFSHPAIAAELKELASNLEKEAIEWDEDAHLAQQWQQWIDPSRLNPVEVKGVAAALLDKLRHIGSMVREETTDLQQQADLVIISELIKKGESQILEFKETLEYDTKENKKNGDVLFSSLKTVAGFLNAKSGTLLIGVDDSGNIKGIERDFSIMKHGNNDRFELKIRNCLKDRFKPRPIGNVNISFHNFAEGTICRVDVYASQEITYLDNKKVYVRDGNTTQELEGQSLTDWIKQR